MTLIAFQRDPPPGPKRNPVQSKGGDFLGVCSSLYLRLLVRATRGCLGAVARTGLLALLILPQAGEGHL
jgi:hypothetical protein